MAPDSSRTGFPAGNGPIEAQEFEMKDLMDATNLESAPLEEVFEQLRASREGLSNAEAADRLRIFGENKLEEKAESSLLKFLGFLWNPLAWVMEMAALVAIVVANGQGLPPDWPDFVGIVVLLLLNATLSFVEENSAGKAAAALMARLAPVAKVLRDGQWHELPASQLVPGDIVSIRGGDIVPADCRLLEGEPLKIDQSALTGESLPVDKGPGDEVYSGSTCKQGELQGLVIATGLQTFFGKAAHLVSTTQQRGHFQKVLATIGSFCIIVIFIGIIVEIIVMYPIQKRRYRDGINNILVLLIGGIPIAMPTVLSVTMAIGSHHLADQGAIVKRMTAIEEMAGMDILCSDKTGTLTLNRLTVDKSLTSVFALGMTEEDVLLLAARASRMEHPDAIDRAILNTLDDISQAREGIKELHFLPFNPVDKRAAITYQLPDGTVERVCKGAPEQVLDLAHNKDEIKVRVLLDVEQFADRGLRSLGVARQFVPEGPAVGAKGQGGGPWEMIGLLPLLDPPRHDTAETIERALQLGVTVKMITGDQLAIGKETARRLGMGTNLFPSSILINHTAIPVGTSVHELVENADGFAGVFPEHKYNIVKLLQERHHLVGMTGDGVNDAPALKKADIGIAVADATDAARDAADIVLTQPGLSPIISAIMRSRIIFQRMKNYTIYAVSITIRIVLGFLLLALIWQFDFPPFMVLIIAILNDGTIMTISKDRVRPSQHPDAWHLKEIFAIGIVFGLYLALWTVLFYQAIRTDFFTDIFGVPSISSDYRQQASAIYLQVSIISQALIFVTRSHGLSYLERPGMLLCLAFIAAQLVATLISVYAEWDFVPISGIGWSWAGVVWLYNVIFYIPLDFLKVATRYVMEGRAWDLLIERKAFFTRAANYGQRERQARWALEQRSMLEGRPPPSPALAASRHAGAVPDLVIDARRRAEIAQLRSRQTLKGQLESVLRERGADAQFQLNKAYTL